MNKLLIGICALMVSTSANAGQFDDVLNINHTYNLVDKERMKLKQCGPNYELPDDLTPEEIKKLETAWDNLRIAQEKELEHRAKRDADLENSNTPEEMKKIIREANIDNDKFYDEWYSRDKPYTTIYEVCHAYERTGLSPNRLIFILPTRNVPRVRYYPRPQTFRSTRCSVIGSSVRCY